MIIAEECISAKITYAVTCKYDLTMEQTRIYYINIISTVDQKRKIVHSFLDGNWLKARLTTLFSETVAPAITVQQIFIHIAWILLTAYRHMFAPPSPLK